ncbi:MAG TPA: thioredoxin domain-containing protein [Methanomassiliicoccales archaeon]|nr:thioredoxin domain-containing protein [Methanomassiliicoccales archaeon]
MTARTNRLSAEKSPYLLQHAQDPVDWFPWGQEAFDEAAKKDRPIFLSIGYSSCHWCHVMQHECFADPKLAELMNVNFINIKVDREERPDIDAIYMRACQMMTGGGGWPLSIVMTPDRRPFYAGTYIPRNARGGMLGMMELAPMMGQVWRERRKDIEQVAGEIMSKMRTPDLRGDVKGLEGTLKDCFEQLSSSYEDKYGGFETAPKFPTPHRVMFLLRYWYRTGDENALDMAHHTLKCMAQGGIQDHVGFGFHRYATDRRWNVPHFEKMLYDQALISMAMTECYLSTGDKFLRKVAQDTITYVIRDLGAPDGGFHSSEDADSEGGEGAYYTWSEEEAKDALVVEDNSLFFDAFDIREGGNFKNDAGGYTGRNILHLTNDMEALALQRYIPVETVSSTLLNGLRTLYKARLARSRPRLDDKVLLDWNALMVVALAKAAWAFGRGDYAERAAKVIDFIESRMIVDGTMMHRYRQGEAAIPAFLDDHAFYVWALIELYGADPKARYIDRAVERADEMMAIFSAADGGFYLTRPDSMLIAREKEAYDGAVPSGNSVAAYALTKLHHITQEPRFLNAALACLSSFSADVNRMPAAHTFMLMAQDLQENGHTHVSLVSEKDTMGLSDMRKVIGTNFVPDLIYIQPSDGGRPWSELPGWKKEIGRTYAHVCKNGRCLPPIDNAEELEKAIKER